jgi:F-type H+-transporting ATPase subunit delta
MVESKVAVRYARSILELARERGIAEQINNDMLLVINTVQSSRELAAVLHNPTIRGDKKLAILNQIFGTRVDALSLSFMQMIARKRREGYLPAIAKQYNTLYKQSKGVETVVVTTAAGLDDKLREEVYALIRKSTHAETIELIEQVDKSLIGGFVLRLGDRQFDASIAKSLGKFSKELLSNVYIRQN